MKNKLLSRAPVFFVCVLIFLLFLFLYQKQQSARPLDSSPIEETRTLLNTVVSVKIYDSTDTSLLDGVMDLCEDYEHVFSRTKDDSELYQLNHRTQTDSTDSFQISSDLAALLEKGLYYSELSNGSFDISIAPISCLWDFTSGRKIVPESHTVESLLPLVNYKNIHLSHQTVQFDHPQTQIDLGAIAKGFIADRMKEYLLSHGVSSAIINLGGNVLCIGSKPDGKPFQIGIQKPFADRNETAATISISDRSVVSSGIYERYFEKDGTLYHHILDPATGYPCDNNLISVTVITDASVDGDALSTTCFSLGLERGMDLINSLENVQAAFITDDYQIHYSEGFMDEIPVEES